jgi:choice-of-anchor B domain-containing protein
VSRRSPALLLLLLIPAASDAQVTTRNMTLTAHLDEYHVPVALQSYAYSACWSYVHTDGREYAVIGTSGGTAIYNVTNPAAIYRTGFIAGPPSIWREMKQYRTWMYVVTEGHAAGQGLQVIRMTDPEHPVLAATWTSPTFVSAHTVAVDTARAILLVNGTRSDAGGGAYPFQGMQILSLASPEAPVQIGVWPAAGPYDATNYVHDCVPVGNRLYASSIYAGTERVFDLTTPAAPVQLNAWTYPSAFYTHNSWPDSTGRRLFVTDERNGQTLRVFDIGDVANPLLVNGISANPVAIVHNAHVRGHELFLSNYTEGIRALDITDPSHPAEFGWADSYPGPSGGYGGVWEVCPFFPSGTVIASDMETGLYVYRPQRNYGLLRVRVVDAVTGDPIAGVRVRLTTQGDSLVTPADGTVQFAPTPGTHTVTADHFGDTSASATRAVAAGDRDSVTLALALKPTTTFAGTVRDRSSNARLEGGEVDLAYAPLQAFTDTTGAYSLTGVPDDDYLVSVRRPGYVPVSFTRHIGPATAGEDYRLVPAPLWDALETGAGWTAGVTGDDATAGRWVLAAPFGTGTAAPEPLPAAAGPASPAAFAREAGLALPAGAAGAPGAAWGSALPAFAARWLGTFASGCGDAARAAMGEPCPGTGDAQAAGATGAAGEELPVGHCGCGVTCVCGAQFVAATSGQIKPWSDRTPGSGTRCFITGQATSHSNPDNFDLDGGRTTLLSPVYDLSAYPDPVIGWWRWFYSQDPGTGQPDDNDWLDVEISDDGGSTWVTADFIRGVHNAWEEQRIRVRDFATNLGQIRVRWIAADLGPGSTVEAGVDDITVYDASQAQVAVPSPVDRALAFTAPEPNPSRAVVRLALRVPRVGDVTAEVLDVGGRRMRTLHRGPALAGVLELQWDGRDTRGAVAPAGLYFVEAKLGAEHARARLVRVP